MSQILQHQTGLSIGSVITLSGDGGTAVSPDGAGNVNLQSAVGSGLTLTSDAENNEVILDTTGARRFLVTSVDDSQSPYTALPNDVYLTCDTLSGTLTIALPNTTDTGRFYIIKDGVGFAGTNNITVTTVGGTVLIDSATSFTINSNYEVLRVIFNGVSYEIW